MNLLIAAGFLVLSLVPAAFGDVALVTVTPTTTSSSLLFGNTLTITPNVSAATSTASQPVGGGQQTGGQQAGGLSGGAPPVQVTAGNAGQNIAAPTGTISVTTSIKASEPTKSSSSNASLIVPQTTTSQAVAPSASSQVTVTPNAPPAANPSAAPGTIPIVVAPFQSMAAPQATPTPSAANQPAAASSAKQSQDGVAAALKAAGAATQAAVKQIDALVAQAVRQSKEKPQSPVKAEAKADLAERLAELPTTFKGQIGAVEAKFARQLEGKTQAERDGALKAQAAALQALLLKQQQTIDRIMKSGGF